MLHRTVARALIGAGAIALSATVIPAAGASPAPAAVITLHYDASQAAEFKSAVAAGVASWNASVHNVHIVAATAGTRAEIQVVAFDGWPQSNLGPVRPGGRVTVWFGRQAVSQGYNTTRIAAHDYGDSSLLSQKSL